MDSPVIIGGVGGSGTRVVAEIVSRLGYFMGNDLNYSKDNLLYTLLFKRPKWFYRNHKNTKNLKYSIDVFRKINKGEKIGLEETLYVTNALFEMYVHGHNLKRDGSGLVWPAKRVYRMMFGNKYDESKHLGWGWKEPNSHLLIDEFKEYFGTVRYIHAIRNRLDMAFSKNQQQLYNRGKLFDIDPFELDEKKASFKYWIRANSSAIRSMNNLDNGEYHVIKFENLCSSTKEELKKMGSFLDIRITQEFAEEIDRYVRTPESVGRHRSRDLSRFEKKDISSLRKFDYNDPSV